MHGFGYILGIAFPKRIWECSIVGETFEMHPGKFQYSLATLVMPTKIWSGVMDIHTVVVPSFHTVIQILESSIQTAKTFSKWSVHIITAYSFHLVVLTTSIFTIWSKCIEVEVRDQAFDRISYYVDVCREWLTQAGSIANKNSCK